MNENNFDCSYDVPIEELSENNISEEDDVDSLKN